MKKRYSPVIMVAMATVALSPVAVAETFGGWAGKMFTPEQSAIAGPAADPDGDGMPNLLEYALDGDPLYPDATEVLPTSAVEGGALVFDFKRDTSRADVVLTVERSADLKTWSEAPSEVLSVRKSVEKRRASAKLGNGAYFRLRAVQQQG